ncbi:MAG: IS66 family insertion sequence element accessory protein TnpA [Myxococcota bacterium]
MSKMRRRKARSRSYWERVVAEYERSGLRTAEFAEQRRLKLSTFRSWVSTLRRERRERAGQTAAPLCLVEVAVRQERQAPTEALRVFVPGGVVVEVPPGSDVGAAGELVRGLMGGAAC